MSRICRDCELLKNGTRSLDDPHEYLVMTGRSRTNGSVFYRCLLCKTFLTHTPDDDGRRWNAGFLPTEPGREQRLSG